MKNRNTQTHTFRIPPQAIEVEKHILGAIFLDRDALDEVSRVLTPADFYLERHTVIFQAAMALQAKHSQCDLITIRQEMTRQGTFEIVGDGYLMEISSEVVSSANAHQHAEIVKEKAISREVIARATKILEVGYDESKVGAELIDMAENEMYRASEMVRGARRGLIPMDQAVRRTIQQFADTVEGKSSRTRIGIPAIDDVMKGFRIGSLNVLAARPGMGKSALALQAAVQCGLPVPFFALEMTVEEEVERMIAQMDSSLNSDSLTDAAIIMAKKQVLADILKKVSNYPIEICDETDVTPAYMRSEIRRMKRKYGNLGIIVADYLQIIKAEATNRRRDLEVGSISTDLKRMAAEMSTPLLAVASLSRKCEERDNKRPIESDLREAGQIEFDAHSIIFLYQESRYNALALADEQLKNVTEALIVKNRGGRRGKTYMDFNGAGSFFHGLSLERQSYYSNFLAGKNFIDGQVNTGQDGLQGKFKKGPKSGNPAASWGKQTDMLPAGDKK